MEFKEKLNKQLNSKIGYTIGSYNLLLEKLSQKNKRLLEKEILGMYDSHDIKIKIGRETYVLEMVYMEDIREVDLNVVHYDEYLELTGEEPDKVLGE